MKVAEKLVDLEYNEQVALAIVENDEDLRNIFLDETKAKSFILLRTLIKENKLGKDSKEFLRMLFDKVILTKQSLIDQYKRLLTNGVEPELEVKNEDKETAEVVLTPTVTEVTPEKIEVSFTAKSKDIKQPKNKVEKEIPRRFGKIEIENKIKEQGGKATPVQISALSVNTLKNMYVNLNARLIKDMFLETKILTDEDYRIITSSIKMLNNKLADILKKK